MINASVNVAIIKMHCCNISALLFCCKLYNVLIHIHTHTYTHTKVANNYASPK